MEQSLGIAAFSKYVVVRSPMKQAQHDDAVADKDIESFHVKTQDEDDAEVVPSCQVYCEFPCHWKHSTYNKRCKDLPFFAMPGLCYPNVDTMVSVSDYSSFDAPVVAIMSNNIEQMKGPNHPQFWFTDPMIDLYLLWYVLCG
jgi:hypothetical protein